MTRLLQENCRRYIACMVAVCKGKTYADKVATCVEKIHGIVDQAKAEQVSSVHCFLLGDTRLQGQARLRLHIRH